MPVVRENNWFCMRAVVLKAPSHGILSYFDLVGNYLEIEGSLKIIV